MSMELVEFLRQRLAEDEAAARAASPGPWHVNAESDEVLAVDDITVADGFALSGPQLRATTAHIARHDPARVLAQVAAMRRMLDLRYSWALQMDKAPAEFRHVFEAQVSAADAIIRGYAAIWAWHDDYDPAWGPS